MSKGNAGKGRELQVQGMRTRIRSLAFASLYRFGGRIYDPFTRLLFGGAWDRWRRMALPLVGDGPVLDIGCGTGVLVAVLALQGHRVVGIDRAQSMLASARRRAGSRGRLVRASASSLPFKAESFQTCLATFPAEFIVQPDTLAEIGRVLRPGGKLAVVLTGQTDDDVGWRLPIHMLLRFFYGSQTNQSIPDALQLSHPSFNGELKWMVQEQDRVLVWTAIKFADGAGL